MKVGTDGVTIGAWAPCSGNVLDVGCGCGLIGLMAAQRGATQVVMLEIEPGAAAEAARNAEASPWAHKVAVFCTDFLEFMPQVSFDSIISNPPFFDSGLLAPDSRRAAARHQGELTPDAFMHHAATLLTPNGTVSVIIPPHRLAEWTFAAAVVGLNPMRVCHLLTKPSAPPRRVLVTFAHNGTTGAPEQLVIASPQYNALLQDFYLNRQ